MIKEQEIWKDIEGYDGDYQVSNHGRVRSFKQQTTRILKGSLNKRTGYYRVSLCKNNKRKIKKIHRLVGIYFVDNPNNKPEINHKDGDKSNNYYKNVEWNTSKENINHAFKMGLMKKGKQHHKSKAVKDLDTGKVYGSAKLAGDDVGLSRHIISLHCRGKYKETKFEYINNN